MVHRSVLEPGEKINEASLAERLGVSRTPLREALHSLEYEGIVRAEPGRGYFVRSFSAKELADLFEVLSLLECRALRLSGRLTPSVVASLREINGRAAAAIEAGELEDAVVAASEWHRTLVSGCPNAQLLRLIDGERQRLYRYGYLHVREKGYPGGVVEAHEDLLDVLSEGDPESTAEALEEHWREAAVTVLEWARARDQDEARDGGARE